MQKRIEAQFDGHTRYTMEQDAIAVAQWMAKTKGGPILVLERDGWYLPCELAKAPTPAAGWREHATVYQSA